MKIEILKACIFILIGAYLCKRFQPETSSNQPVISQVEVKEIEKKSGTVVRKIVEKPDGTKQIDEVETYLSDKSNESKRIEIPADKKTTWAIIPKYSFQDQRGSVAASYSYNNLGILISSDKQIGLVLKFSY
jgi:hypothetical protein